MPSIRRSWALTAPGALIQRLQSLHLRLPSLAAVTPSIWVVNFLYSPKNFVPRRHILLLNHPYQRLKSPFFPQSFIILILSIYRKSALEESDFEDKKKTVHLDCLFIHHLIEQLLPILKNRFDIVGGEIILHPLST